jgi:hypothetical protein
VPLSIPLGPFRIFSKILGTQFFGGVVDTGDIFRLFVFFSERCQRHRGNINCSPVSTTPAINFSPVSLPTVININSRISLRIFEKIHKGSNGILGSLGDTDS